MGNMRTSRSVLVVLTTLLLLNAGLSLTSMHARRSDEDEH